MIFVALKRRMKLKPILKCRLTGKTARPISGGNIPTDLSHDPQRRDVIPSPVA